MGVNEILARSILQKSGIPGVSFVINPYTGCVHGCVYCYARFMKRFTGHAEPWGAFLDAKVNAPDLLKRQLENRKTPLTEEVFLSSVTDPYLPAEKQYQLTRRILEVLLEYQTPISILTKSELVLRDIDLLRQFKRCSVGLSMMTTDDAMASRFEPYASLPSQRIRALKTLKESGVYTYAFLSPYLPRVSNIEHLFEGLQGAIDEIGIEALNVRACNWAGVEKILKEHFPKLLPGYKQLARDDLYWDQLEQQAHYLIESYRLTFMGFFRH
ncbi:radical SAM domain protein [Candidatus Vecturithrix granuli]|uniref:Radical SAM domain protein n=1 Tax=Vecturithrix granuli TaxID=1499967 RepID=A0A081C0U5_VECG1|nr:radical SAM domain protein [Candidatus Vecturithrix granuli]